MAKRKSESGQSQAQSNLAPVHRIEESILYLRGQKVLLDQDLAAMYGVPVKRLNEAVARNIERFPSDFMFRLTKKEFDHLRSQFATSRSWGGRRYPPYAFTEHGAVMLASVLNSPIAIQASVQVVRVFVRLRQLVASNDKLRRKLARIEQILQDHDEQFATVFGVIRQLMDQETEDDAPKARIGYETEAKQHE